MGILAAGRNLCPPASDDKTGGRDRPASPRRLPVAFPPAVVSDVRWRAARAPVGAPPCAEGLLRPARAPLGGAAHPPRREPRARASRPDRPPRARRIGCVPRGREDARDGMGFGRRALRPPEFLRRPPAHPRAVPAPRRSPTARRGRRCALALRPHGPRRPVPSRVVGTGPPEGSSRRPPAQARTRLHRDGEERASGPSGGIPRARDPRVEARLRVGSRRGRDEPLPPPDLSLIHISEPTRLGMLSYAVFS